MLLILSVIIQSSDSQNRTTAKCEFDLLITRHSMISINDKLFCSIWK